MFIKEELKRIIRKVKGKMNSEKIKSAFQSATRSSWIYEGVVYVESTDGKFSEHYEYGNKKFDDPIIMASITKMFTSACIIKLLEEEKISLDDKVEKYFSEEQLKGLHVYKGHEYSYDLTIYNLLFQNSGLPDSFEDGDTGILLQGDYSTTFNDTLAETKKEKPKFAPGTGKKAFYANVNYDMLGEIIMKITGKSLGEAYHTLLFNPLDMLHTYLPQSEKDIVPIGYYGKTKIHRPLTIASCGASGGCISTPADLMLFSKAFWGGKIFNRNMLEKLNVYRRIQANKGPISYGGGYMHISLEGFDTLFMGKGALVGHCGQTGSFMFYYPEKDVHIVGDLAQFLKPAIPIRLSMRLAMTI